MQPKHAKTAARLDLALNADRARVRKGQFEEGTAFKIRRLKAGRLELPTGRLCVTDAYSAATHPALNRIVEPGSYPVQLVIAQLPPDLPFGGQRCAFVVVTFSKHVVARWEPITTVAPADPCFIDKQPNVFVQEGGTALLSPEAGGVHFQKLLAGFEEHIETIRGQAKQFGHNEWVNYRPASNGPNVLIVEGGMGDGLYECFVGLTRAGRVVQIVIDFDIAAPA